jgi:hypothetical protein
MVSAILLVSEFNLSVAKSDICLVLILISLFPAAARAVSYKATLLHPSGFSSSAAIGASGGMQIGWADGSATNHEMHAFLWNGNAQNFVDLNPSGFIFSEALGTDGDSQVGDGDNGVFTSHALLWHGTSASVIDLNPSGFDNSYATAVSANRQVGYGDDVSLGGATRALLWTGTAASFINLHPIGFYDSYATGVSGANQVGWGLFNNNGQEGDSYSHALLWHGSADSVIDLNPPGFGSKAEAVDGDIEVGSGGTSIEHALLWKGTAASVVDLNPAGYNTSNANAIAGDTEVGSGHVYATGQYHALLWHGTAASAVDLQPYVDSLGLGFIGSFASGVDSNGIITGYALDSNYQPFAVIWAPVPEPSTWAMFCSGAAVFCFWVRGRPGR